MDTLRVYLEHYAPLPGWFTEDSAVVWDCLLTFQRAQRIRGHAFEIGVFHGKSAAMTCLHLHADEELVLVDPYRLDMVRDMLAPLRTDGIVCHPCLSSQLPAQDLLPLSGRCRWVHIATQCVPTPTSPYAGSQGLSPSSSSFSIRPIRPIRPSRTGRR